MTTACRAARRTTEERNALAAAHGPLAGWALRHFFGRAAARFGEDLHAAGQLGLLRACELFDEGRGVDFSSFAVYWIRQAMQRELRHSSAITRPARPVAAVPHAGSLVDADGLAIDPADPDAEDPLDAALAAERAAAVRAVLDALPEAHRRVLELRESGETIDATAAEVGLTRGVAIRLESEARERLAGDRRLRELAGQP